MLKRERKENKDGHEMPCGPTERKERRAIKDGHEMPCGPTERKEIMQAAKPLGLTEKRERKENKDGHEMPLGPDGEKGAEDWRLLLRDECADLQGYRRYVRLARAMLLLQRKGLAPRVMIPYGEGSSWCEELSRILGWNVSWKALNRQINILSRCRNSI